VEHDLGREELSGWVDWAVDKVRAMENSPDKEPPPGDPGTADLFGVNVYQRGALTLHALRSTVGDEIFFGILREWVSRYQYANADTEDFIALVAEKTDTVDGFDADAFFDAWLFAKEMPDLP
jgi:aminopeptidase N